MRCEDLAERVTDLLEGDLTPAEETAALAHLAECPRCEAVLAETRDVVALASDYGMVELTDADRGRMLTNITQATTGSDQTRTAP